MNKVIIFVVAIVMSTVNVCYASDPTMAGTSGNTITGAAATGSAKNYDFNLLGGLYRGGAGGLGAFSDRPEGKIIAASFAYTYNQMVVALRNYRAQTVEGGLGKGGSLNVAY